MELRKVSISLPSTGDEEWQAVREPLTTGWLTQGPKVAEFEKAFAHRHEANHALAVSSCTTGLHVVLAALGVGPGDEVLVPAFTWVSTANAVLYCGAMPILVDVDPNTFNVDPNQIAAKISSNTKAVVIVHLFGLCADVARIREALPDGLPIIEDCACAAGASLNGRPAGTLGDAGVFSFHPRKSITTGEGGMITTNNSELAAVCDQLRNHGASMSEEVRHRGPRPYLLPDFNLLGFNYRMTDLQGAVGVVQLRKLDSFIAEREKWARYYISQLSDIAWLKMPTVPIDGQHAWQSFVVLLRPEIAPRSRNEIMGILEERGIATRPGTHAVHMLRYYSQRFSYKPSDFPGAQVSNDHSMAIPLHNQMTSDDFQYVVDVIKEL